MQTCFFKVGSYGFDDSYVKFNLSKEVADLELPKYPVVGLFKIAAQIVWYHYVE